MQPKQPGTPLRPESPAVLAQHAGDAMGQVILSRVGDFAVLSCRWPLDLDEDDWFYQTISVPFQAWREIAAGFASSGVAVVEDETGRAELSRTRQGRNGDSLFTFTFAKHDGSSMSKELQVRDARLLSESIGLEA